MTCLPRSDATFRTFVHRQLSALPDISPSDLEQRLREVYPAAAVHVQDALATLSAREGLWYVYRDDESWTTTPERWWDAPGASHVVNDRDGICIEADDGACDILDLPAGGLVGRSWTDFAVPGAVEAAEDVFAELLTTGETGSTFRVRTARGRERGVDWHARMLTEPPGASDVYVRVREPRPSLGATALRPTMSDDRTRPTSLAHTGASAVLGSIDGDRAPVTIASALDQWRVAERAAAVAKRRRQDAESVAAAASARAEATADAASTSAEAASRTEASARASAAAARGVAAAAAGDLAEATSASEVADTAEARAKAAYREASRREGDGRGAPR